MSAWGLSSSDDSDQEAHTSLTNISDDPEEEEELHQISVELVKDSESDEEGSEEEGSEEDDSTYKTEWYCQYEEQKRLLESSNKRCSNTTDFDSSDTLTEF